MVFNTQKPARRSRKATSLGLYCRTIPLAACRPPLLGRFGFALSPAVPYFPGMANIRKKDQPKRSAVMLGLGLDSDGHKRVTKGPNFLLAGGSAPTHDQMTEKAIKINEKLAERGKRLEEVERAEWDDIAHEVGLRRVEQDNAKKDNE